MDTAVSKIVRNRLFGYILYVKVGTLNVASSNLKAA